MAAEQRKLLEQLMGGGVATRSSQISLTDPKACRSYIAGTCPHDLFTNTKQDLGPCPRVHSESLKAEYEALPEQEKKRHGFEYDYMRDLQKYIEECNRRIDVAQRRLEKTPDEIRQTNVLLKSISDLTASINNGLLEVEILGELGEVGRAYDEFYRVKQAQQQKAERERELKMLSDTSGPSGHQKLQVCDVCGAYLSRLDNDRRLADHFYGKMHLGYAQMRKTFDSFPKEMRGRLRGPMMGGGGMGTGDDVEMGGVPTGPGGGGDWGRGPRGPRGGGGYRGGRGRFRGGW
ncbi:splicing factor [Gnomoniopsis sp. IMI 355080]|nr:splicing factor [Gnomoniopsis sp. IMI 355080]